MDSPLLSVVLPIVITGIFNVWLFRMQANKEKEKVATDNRLTEASAARTYGEAYERLVNDLRDDLERMRTSRDLQEKEFLNQIDNLKTRLSKAEKQYLELDEQNRSLVKLVNNLNERISLLQEENKVLLNDIKKIQHDTGELKNKKVQ